MHHDGNHFVLSPSDVTAHLACAHLTQLKRRVALGELRKPHVDDPHLELIKRRGHDHEAAALTALDGGGHVEIPFPRSTREALAEAEVQTLAAMRSGAPLIYQATFFDGRWRGHADFLERVAGKSALGDWHYEVIDSKLARGVKPAMVHQLCEYSLQLERLQSRMPTLGHVILGTGERVAVALGPVMALHRHARRRLEQELAASPLDTYPEPVSHCQICEWSWECQKRRRADDHLSLVAAIRRDQRTKLRAVDVDTMGALAAAPADHDAGELNAESFGLLRSQAELQVRTRETGELQRRHLEPERARGYARLPAPHGADVFFDLEGDPFVGDHGLEYLWGYELADGDYTVLWAHDEAAERAAFETFVDFLCDRHRKHPGMHVFHYSATEVGTLKRLAARYGSRESEVDHLLRNDVFVDLYGVVRQGLQVGQESYSLKKLEPFYGFARENASIREAGGSIVAYERWIESGDDDLLDALRAYNADDCRSTRLLRDWLWDLRDEAAEFFEVDFDKLRDPEPEEEREEPDWATAAQEVNDRVCEGLPDDEAEDDEAQRQRRMLGWLLMYHRRELRPQWWRFFDLCNTSSDALVAESDAIGGLALDPSRPPEAVDRSTGYWMTFPPQETRLELDEVVDPKTKQRAGTIVDFDPLGSLLLKRGASFDDVPLPEALIGRKPLPTDAQRSALIRLAESVLAGDGRYPAIRSIAQREPPAIDGVPRGAPLQTGDVSVEDTVRLALGVRDSHLVIQGPPGTGKTYRGARIVVEALRRGERVAISALSHKAIHNLLREVEKVAAQEGVEVRGMHKCSDEASEYRSAHGFISSTKSNPATADPELNLVSGTAWLLSRPEHDGEFDRLVVDEAGQVALADVCAMGTCADSIILLGDPQQLPQVTQGVHPGTSGASVLEHLLAGAATIPADRGLFITQSRRMHPDVCAFISEAMYDGRLESIPECARRRVDAPGGLSGAGLRWLPVEHTERSQSSPEEAELIAALCTDLLRDATVTEADGTVRALTADDILVVAPYNLAVRCIQAAVPSGVRVGTVDKFQGQEAPVVFYAMASSSGEDAPRGLDFLFSANRLNVAVSRAQCLAVVVASPRLLDANTATVAQMELVSRLCRFVELAH